MVEDEYYIVVFQGTAKAMAPSGARRIYTVKGVLDPRQAAGAAKRQKIRLQLQRRSAVDVTGAFWHAAVLSVNERTRAARVAFAVPNQFVG